MAYTFAYLGVRQIAQSARIFSPVMNALGQKRKSGPAILTSVLPLNSRHLPTQRSRPKSAISRHRAHGGAELRWNADTFAEMHRSIAVAACEE
jgi:hypothetical protein